MNDNENKTKKTEGLLKYTLQKKLRIILTDFIQCAYM